MKFDAPIEIGKGPPLRTQRDAASYVIALPASETKRMHWLLAVQCLMAAAEKRGLVQMAQIAVVKAINKNAPEPGTQAEAGEGR